MTTEELFNREFRLPEDNPAWRLSSWKEIAKQEIRRWIEDEAFSDYVTANVMQNEWMGPFTKFLYHFAHQCKGCGWGVMIDFNEYSQRVFLPDRYYKWMHEVREEVYKEIEEQSLTH